ncbi:hypothetical protein [Pseudomonas sp. A-B-26]|uniref:hypothetical protein n=1 Tax=Pseudomonas sp. A-B-26 TaxID=2832406 RepID=UPI001CC02C1F|nr:hypothetical protein [Pseudomonas sp. A-B-26]
MPAATPLIFDTPKVIGVYDADVDPEGNIPSELLQTGIDVVIPLWPEPSTEPDERDILTVYFERTGQVLAPIVNTYYPQDLQPEFIVHLGPEYLRGDGVAELWYELLNSADNHSYSFRRYLTIDHAPIKNDLVEAHFPHATINGYLNCSTVPPLWSGVTVEIAPLGSEYAIGDRIEVEWEGFDSLNGSGAPIANTYKKITKTIQADTELRESFTVVVLPYEVHIKPMIIKSSAIVKYSVYRGGRLKGRAPAGLVRIDRIIPGTDLPCGP